MKCGKSPQPKGLNARFKFDLKVRGLQEKIQRAVEVMNDQDLPEDHKTRSELVDRRKRLLDKRRDHSDTEKEIEALQMKLAKQDKEINVAMNELHEFADNAIKEHSKGIQRPELKTKPQLIGANSTSDQAYTPKTSLISDTPLLQTSTSLKAFNIQRTSSPRQLPSSLSLTQFPTRPATSPPAIITTPRHRDHNHNHSNSQAVFSPRTPKTPGFDHHNPRFSRSSDDAVLSNGHPNPLRSNPVSPAMSNGSFTINSPGNVHDNKEGPSPEAFACPEERTRQGLMVRLNRVQGAQSPRASPPPPVPMLPGSTRRFAVGGDTASTTGTMGGYNASGWSSPVGNMASGSMSMANLASSGMGGQEDPFMTPTRRLRRVSKSIRFMK